MKSINTILDVPVDFSFLQMPKVDIEEIGTAAQMVDPVHEESLMGRFTCNMAHLLPTGFSFDIRDELPSVDTYKCFCGNTLSSNDT